MMCVMSSVFLWPQSIGNDSNPRAPDSSGEDIYGGRDSSRWVVDYNLTIPLQPPTYPPPPTPPPPLFPHLRLPRQLQCVDQPTRRMTGKICVQGPFFQGALCRQKLYGLLGTGEEWQPRPTSLYTQLLSSQMGGPQRGHPNIAILVDCMGMKKQLTYLKGKIVETRCECQKT